MSGVWHEVGDRVWIRRHASLDRAMVAGEAIERARLEIGE